MPEENILESHREINLIGKEIQKVALQLSKVPEHVAAIKLELDKEVTEINAENVGTQTTVKVEEIAIRVD